MLADLMGHFKFSRLVDPPGPSRYVVIIFNVSVCKTKTRYTAIWDLVGQFKFSRLVHTFFFLSWIQDSPNDVELRHEKANNFCSFHHKFILTVVNMKGVTTRTTVLIHTITCTPLKQKIRYKVSRQLVLYFD